MREQNLERKCPNCKEKIIYKTYGGFLNGKNNDSICRKCASIRSGFTQRYATKGANTGADNAFYKKTHTEENKEKTRQRSIGRKDSVETREKKRLASTGSKNSMYGVSVYEHWVKLYGKEEADKRQAQTSKKHSINNTGSGNPMYGKPSPQGTGNGWKGWYKGDYFRSLRELCFMLENPDYKTAENIQIKCVNCDGSERTYRPDFIIGNTIYELKPKKLFNSPNNKLKFIAATEYCKKNNLKFVCKDQIIDSSAIRKELDLGNIKFDRKYLERFQEYENAYND